MVRDTTLTFVQFMVEGPLSEARLSSRGKQQFELPRDVLEPSERSSCLGQEVGGRAWHANE